jgi:hypothetical protein
MDHEHTCVDEDHHDLKEVASAIGADHEIARRVLAKFDPRDGLPVGVLDVLIADTVPASRRVDLHTQ